MRGLIACEDLMRALLGCGFDEVFLFLDCCRLKLNTVNMPPPTISSANSFQPPAPVCGVCSAAQMNKAAFETATSPIRGAFSKALLQGLRTVRGPAQALTIEKLGKYVRGAIKFYTNEEQKPSFRPRPDDLSLALLRGPPIPVDMWGPPLVGQIFANIVIDFGDLPSEAVARLVDHNGDALGAPFLVESRRLSLAAPIGRFYALDISEPRRSEAFEHPGPGETHVSL